MNDITAGIAARPEIIATERVERDAWLDMFAAAPAVLGADAPPCSERTGTYAVIADKGTPGSEFNRCFGLGCDGALTEVQLDRAIHWLDRNASPTWSIQLPPLEDADTMAGWMRSRGLAPAGTGWARFFRHARSVGNSPAPTELVVREVSRAEGAHFGEAMMGGFGFSAAVGKWFSVLAGRPRWHLYVAYADGVPAACGALYLDHERGWGWLGCDATLPAYRLRGAQTALIHRRIADAGAAGIEALTAETGQPAAGQELNARSYQNYHRAGFAKAYVRPNFRRRP